MNENELPLPGAWGFCEVDGETLVSDSHISEVIWFGSEDTPPTAEGCAKAITEAHNKVCEHFMQLLACGCHDKGDGVCDRCTHAHEELNFPLRWAVEEERHSPFKPATSADPDTYF